MTAGQTLFTIAHFAKRALLLNINFYLSSVFSLKTTSTLFFKFISKFKCIFKMLCIFCREAFECFLKRRRDCIAVLCTKSSQVD